jgi:hypothetical protein
VVKAFGFCTLADIFMFSGDLLAVSSIELIFIFWHNRCITSGKNKKLSECSILNNKAKPKDALYIAGTFPRRKPESDLNGHRKR